MALTDAQLTTFLPSEIFFLGEDEEIEILSLRKLTELQLIGLKTPKLDARRYSKVPLWLALLLKKQNRCKIVMPSWLEQSYLKEAYDEEVSARHRFSDKLPWHWLEIGHALLDAAADDVERGSPSEIRSMLQDLREIRQAKARSGIRQLNESHIQMDNLGHMELNELRPFICGVMDQLRKVRAYQTEEGGDTNM